MISQETLQEKIRSTYFELISDIEHESYSKLLSKAVKQLTVLLNMTHSAVYIYNNWNKTYEIKTDFQENGPLKQSVAYFYEDNMDQHVMDGSFVFKEKDKPLNSIVIPLLANDESPGFLFFTSPENTATPSDHVIDLLKMETERLLKLFNYYISSQHSEERNKFLFDLSSRLNASSDKQDILTKIVQGLEKLYPSFSYYLLLSQDYDADSSLPVKAIEYSDDATKRVSTQAFLSGEVQLENRLTDKNTALYAPLRGKQAVYGVLQLITPCTIGFPDEEIDFISQFANTAGAAIENITLYQHSRNLISDLKLINDATHKLNSNLKLSEIIAILKKQIINACPASQVGFLYVQDEPGGQFDFLTGSTNYFATNEGKLFAEYILKEIEENGEPIFSGNFKRDKFRIPYGSVMIIPMIQSGMIHGAVIIMEEEKYSFSFENFKLMQSLIQHSTLALTNSILRGKLEKAVITDYLTNLYSRNHLDESLKDHMATDEKGALILFDIDDFKKINDTYGHYIGDEVIVQVADIIRTQLGEEDIPARWGGEELAIYLPNASIDDGVTMAGQIRKQVENFTEPKITLSSGVASWVDKTKDSVSEVFIRADKALYEAKNMGKNCVVKAKELKKYPEL
ncbi:sensor domain-containing diguanylate cyclase [Virgibacillus doumboii]|uniref:sensor domain-containing diguanylate cyclase n=1 Tax=Virgibacillus doumboii TaxID=2697503 RepID=UPI0013E00D1F|nr:sensor domain-containing diguanylate cyclase [Virgibacillus doumboii]